MMSAPPAIPAYSVSQPALFAHDLDAHDAAVAAGRGVDAVNDVGGDIHRRMEAERDVGAIDVVVDGLGQPV